MTTDVTKISGPTAPVPRDPQPSVDRIDELAGRILSGDVLLPKFQREFVWERSQILILLDSIARGYPIGSILLWQSKQELRSENAIADLDIELPRPGYPVNYLLDGQQRLSTICGALYWKPGKVTDRWNIAFDLRTQKFVHLETIEDPPQHQIRVNKLSDAVAYFKHVASLDSLASKDKDELKQRAELLFGRFKDYKIAVVTLGDMELNDVAPIFERINSQGTPLTIVDLTRAATWSPQFDLIDAMNEVRSELERKDFSQVDDKVLLRSMSASAGHGFTAENIEALRKHSADELKAFALQTKDAYKRSADFLHTQLRVPGAEVLPYSNQLVVLSEIFRRIPTPNAAQYEAISQWFWRTSLSGYFSGWNTGMMGQDLKAIEQFALNKTTGVKVDIQKPNPSIWLKPFRLNNAHSKLLALVLAQYAPIDLLSGQKVDVGKALAWSNAKEFHHFFPKEYLIGIGYPLNKINALSNIVIITSATNKTISKRAPSDYLKDVATAAGANLDSWLSSHLVTKEAYEAALKDDFEKFLTIRSETINSTISSKAGW